MGGKYGMGTRILARRDAHPTLKVAGLLDGDFLGNWPAPKLEPVSWQSANGAIQFGWRWSRKEIENYLIDPHVVMKALGRDTAFKLAFEALIHQGVEVISISQAARTALSSSRRQFTDLPSKWWSKLLPGDLSAVACRAGIAQVIEQHAAQQTIGLDEVTERFDVLLPEFAAGGVRRTDFLWTFSGNDILLICAQHLIDIGFASPSLFKESVLLGIEESNQDIASWLEEWARLREEIASF